MDAKSTTNETKSIILSLLVVLALAFLLGIAVGYSMQKDTVVASSSETVVVEKTEIVVAYRTSPVFVVKEVCNAPMPRVHKHFVCVQCAIVEKSVQDTIVHSDIVQEVVDMTTTATPAPTATPTPIIVEPTPEPTETVVPTDTPEPTKQHCDNGVGNGGDCPPPGHDKNDDGVADTPKGDNDDDNNNRPCGDHGNPCNKSAKKDFIVPLFVLDALMNWVINYKNKHYSKSISVVDIGNPLLDHFLYENDSDVDSNGLCQGCAYLGDMNMCTEPKCKNYTGYTLDDAMAMPWPSDC